MSKFSLFLGLAGTALLTACGGSAPDPKAEPTDDYVVEASPSARDELGVVAWHGSNGAGGAKTIRGISEAGGTIIELETMSASGPDGKHLTQRVSNGDETVTFDLATTLVDGKAHYQITNGVTEASTALRRALVRLNADLARQRPSDSVCGYLVLCETPPIVQCTGQFITASMDCPGKLVSAVEDSVVKLGTEISATTEAGKTVGAACAAAVANAVDACDETPSARPVGAAPDEACSPACDAGHVCVAMREGDYAVPMTNGRGCLAE